MKTGFAVLATQAPSANTCSCFDEDCRDLDHMRCYLGGARIINGVAHWLPPTDGACPYLAPKQRNHPEIPESSGGAR